MAMSMVYSQSVTYTENFDGNTISYTSSPVTAWKVDTHYYVSPSKSYLGTVPNLSGQQIILESPVCDFTNYLNVYLNFKHICKVSPMDTVRIEYRISGQTWQTIPSTAYYGAFVDYGTKDFSAASYPEWQAGDSTALPDQSWWKEENFDLGFYVGGSVGVQFRFVLKRGNTPGTQISYGWLLDDIEIIGSTVEVKTPLVELIPSYPAGDMYSAGPFPVQARVKSNTSAAVSYAELYYTSTLNNVSTPDTVLMTAFAGDSLWKTDLPAFELGTEINYYVLGADLFGNTATTETINYSIKVDSNTVYDSVAAALDNFISPVQGKVSGGTTVSITVRLHNKGLKDLTSATIYWTLNGNSPTSFPWTGNLPWDLTTSVNLGNYTSRTGDFDTIKVWVSQPNGVANAQNVNDTIIIMPYGCSSSMAGVYTVGAGGFGSWSVFAKVLQNCVPTGNITLEFVSDTHRQAIDLTNISTLMNGHALTLTSQSGNPNDAVIQVAGTGITLNNSNNITIKALTIDVSSGNNRGIDFTGPCSNVMIRDCRILTSTSATADNVAPIYKAASTGMAHNISFIDNVLDGGHAGIRFYNGTNSAYGSNIVIDSNTITNTYYSGLYLYYADFNSISFNKITSKTSNFSTEWSGMYIFNINSKKISANRIFSPNTKTAVVRGLYLHALNLNFTQDTALICNNEISLFANTGGSGMYTSGMFFEECVAKVLHNSIYYAGARANNGIYVYTPNNLSIKYNNIVMADNANAAPINLVSGFYGTLDIDYNNLRAPTYAGSISGTSKSMTEWKDIVTTDKNSFSILPAYTDVGQSLKQTDYSGFTVTAHPNVSTDIDGYSRTVLTNIGCYHGAANANTTDAMLVNLTGWENLLVGNTEILKAIIWNTGSTPIDSIVFHWSLGGVSQLPVTWTGNLLPDAVDTVIIGQINHTALGAFTIKVYIDNMGDLIDGNKNNDTLSVNALLCTYGVLGGVYNIGTGTGNHFASFNDVFNELQKCGISSDVTLAFETGNYSSIDLSNISNYTNGYTLTLTSQSGVAGDVKIIPPGAAGTAENGITLNNSNNIVIKGITIDITQKTAANSCGVRFTGACTNVVIRDCRILASITTTSTIYPVYKPSGTGIANNISIINNDIDGGYCTYFYAGTGSSAFGTQIRIDSNRVTNTYYYGFRLGYAHCSSVSFNTITSRNTLARGWSGIEIYVNSNIDSIIGNRIRQTSSNTYAMVGINTYNLNNNIQPALVANNEIILASTSANTRGIATSSVIKAKFLHNSIYISGTAAGSGIYIAYNYSSSVEAKYNNIVLPNSGASAIYVAGQMLPNCTFDYNNLYATNVGNYGGTTYSTIADWQNVVTTDHNSFKKLPSYLDVTQSLKQTDYSGFDMTTIAEVPTDIDKISRSTITHIGCYHGTFTNADAEMKAFVDLKQSGVAGGQDIVKVMVFNGGETTLDTIVFQIEVNGIPQTQVTWTGSIPFGVTDTITVGSVNYTAVGSVNLKVYIANLGDLTDDKPSNDTLQANIYVCSAFMIGTQIIGSDPSDDFATVEDALNQLKTCSAGGDITFALKPNTSYPADIDLTGISNYMNGYTLTFTSQSGSASDVVITKSSAGSGFILNNSHNIVIRNLTISMTSTDNNTYGIEFRGACTNVVIRDCYINSSSTSNQQIAPIKKANSTGVVDNISIIHNTLNGGYGINFYGGTAAANKATNVIFDSNTVINTGMYAASFYYTDFKSIFNNRIEPRTAGITEWYGLYLSYCNGNIIGNRFGLPSGTTSVSFQVTGMYLEYLNDGVPDAALIYNNEILLGSNTSGFYNGIYLYRYNNAKILFNSIYYAGNGNANGIDIYRYNTLEIKYNNIAMASNNAYAVYVENINNTLMDFDYNNIYAPNHVGYLAGTGDINNLTAWKTAFPTDANSVSVAPVFDNVSTSLKLTNNNPLLKCPLVSPVLDDIEGKQRYVITQRGAYTTAQENLDIILLGVVNTNAVSGYPYIIKVSASNSGLTDVDSAVLKWSVNGSYQGSTLWKATPAFTSGANREIEVGSFIFTGTPTTVSVWVDSVNTGPSAIAWNDTVTANLVQVPVAWFTDPLVPDVITSREFDVHAVIMENSGVLVVDPTPVLYVETSIGFQTVNDTLDMSYANGKWSAHIPPKYYGSKIVYSLILTDTTMNTITLIDSTFIEPDNGSNPYSDKNLTLTALHGLEFGNTDCLPDATDLNLDIVNTGNSAFDFSQDSLVIYLEVQQPVVFTARTVIKTGGLSVGEKLGITMAQNFSLIVAGQYDFVVHATVAGDNIAYDDTLVYNYVSGRFGLPIDEDFSNGKMDMSLNSVAIVGNSQWTIISSGSGSDTAVVPQFGNGILAFNGSIGSMSRLYTKQLDLSRTHEPSLSFWYFHDTLPIDDEMYVLLTIDGGETYTELSHLQKGNPVFGWSQYNIDLPPFANNQCVFIVFEATARSRNLNVTQYIDRIRITAKQDIEVTDILIPSYSICDLDNKELKVVMSNLSDLPLNYASTPTTLTLEIMETGQTFTYSLTGILDRYDTDTVTVVTDFDFEKGKTYTFKSYFSSVLDVNSQNDTLVMSPIVINPSLSVRIQSLSTPGNYLRGDDIIYPQITLYNTGNMDIPNTELIFQIDTGEAGSHYTLFQESSTSVIHAGDTLDYTFANTYKVPWTAIFYPRVTAWLSCDSTLINTVFATSEYVDIEDLYMVSIDEPSAGNDMIGEAIQAKVTIANHSDYNSFSASRITLAVKNSQGVEVEKITDTTVSIGMLSTISHTFTKTYTVPNDSVYYLTVYLDSYDSYLFNDTMTKKRVTEKEDYDLSVSIDNPNSESDVAGSAVQISVSIHNSSGIKSFTGLPVTALIENSQGIEIAKLIETVSIGILSTISHTFTDTYTVPTDSVYYLTVYIESYDDYPHNDTVSLIRKITNVGIGQRESGNTFTLSQNIPNPANNSTRINYSIPEAGEVIFHVHSISGQLLYSKTIDTKRGTNSIELNTSTFAAGIYFYSMEYKGQRLVRQLIINATN
jgi:hypothetical protein